MKIVVEIDNIINAEVACELEIKRRHKAMGALKIVTDRGLEVLILLLYRFCIDWLLTSY